MKALDTPFGRMMYWLTLGVTLITLVGMLTTDATHMSNTVAWAWYAGVSVWAEILILLGVSVYS